MFAVQTKYSGWKVYRFSTITLFSLCSIQIYEILPILVHRMRHRKDMIPRDLIYHVCKEEIENEVHDLFSCEGYNDLRNNVKLLEKPYTETSDVSYVSR